MKVIEKITESILFKNLVKKVNELIDSNNEQIDQLPYINETVAKSLQAAKDSGAFIGSYIFVGNEVTEPDTFVEVKNAEVGDLYINSDTGDLYMLQIVEDSLVWCLKSNITGPKGDKGDKGDYAEWGYIANKPAIEKGTGTGAIKFNSSSDAVGDNSCASGYNSVAGILGYYYSNISFGEEILVDGKPSGTYGPCVITLTKEQGVTPSNPFIVGYTKGDVISLINNNKYIDCATIIDITGNLITVDALPFSKVSTVQDPSFDDYSFYVLSKPLSGEVSLGHYAWAEGDRTLAAEWASHAEGRETIAYGQYAHAEGRNTKAGYNAHAEGRDTVASATICHAEGYKSKASGSYGSHAEGYATEATGKQGSHAEGNATLAEGDHSHAEGYKSKALGLASHAEGQSTASGVKSHAEGYATNASGDYSHAEGYETTAFEEGSHAEGKNTWAKGKYSHAEGNSSIARGNYSHSEGQSSEANGDSSHAEGYTSKADGIYAHAEGLGSQATGNYSHAENNGIASGSYSHAEGYRTTSSGSMSHSEGAETTAEGNYSHAEGNGSVASGVISHAEGAGTEAIGNKSHAEGQNTIASGETSHVEGYYTIAKGRCQHVQGKFNIEDTANKYAHIVGGGNGDTDRKNIHTVDWSGNAEFAGTVVSNGKRLATEEYVQNYIEETLLGGEW